MSYDVINVKSFSELVTSHIVVLVGFYDALNHLLPDRTYKYQKTLKYRLFNNHT